MATELEITIAHQEREGSPQEASNFTDGFAATRLLECDWEDRLDLKDQLMGKTTNVEGVTSWFLPHLYPYGNEIARVTNVQIEPFGETGGNANDLTPQISYLKALLTVNYAVSTMSYTEPTQEHNIVDSLSGSVKVLATPGQGVLFWGDDSTVNVENSPSTQLIMQEWTRNISRVKSIPQSVFDGVGKVNNAAVSYRGFGVTLTFEKETLLMLPIVSRDEFAPDGERFLNVTAKFVWIGDLTATAVEGGDITHAGWNHSFKPGNGLAERIWITQKGGGAHAVPADIFYSYQLTDLDSVLDSLED